MACRGYSFWGCVAKGVDAHRSEERNHFFRNVFSARFATNTATISTFSISSLPIPGIPAGFTKERLRSITMPAALVPSD